ncbi:MAG: zinc-ribbon domain-containing protein [Fibrobacterales bacterium]
MSKKYFICPNCGEEVAEGKLACPSCGSDADTGWNDDTLYDNVGLPEEEIYPADPSGKKSGEVSPVLKIIAWVVLGLFLYLFVLR